MDLSYIVVEETIQYNQTDTNIIGIYNNIEYAEKCALEIRRKYGYNRLSNKKEIYVHIIHMPMNKNKPPVFVQDIEPKYMLKVRQHYIK